MGFRVFLIISPFILVPPLIFSIEIYPIPYVHFPKILSAYLTTGILKLFYK